MDMQNVSNLVISEGEVKTIHDSAGNLFWGRLAYDIKYAGDTSQDGAPTPDAPIAVQTVTGEQTVNISDGVTSRDYVIDLTSKNLFDKTMPIIASDYSTVSQIADGIRVTATGGGMFRYVRYLLFSTEDYIGKTITLSVDMQASASNKPRFSLGLCDANGQNRTSKIDLVSSGSASYVVENDSSRPYFFLNVYSNTDGTVQSGDYVDYTNIQLEVGSATAYAPYYNYELCKIGDYRDYIYKSGDDWYLHKETDGFVANGSENWVKNGSSRQDLSIPNIVRGSASNNPVISSRYISSFSTSVNNSVFLSGAANALCVYDTIHAIGTPTWASWLSSNNTTFYYALATPTDTKITDATLISQLEALNSAQLPKPIANITVSATGTNLTPYLTIAYYGSDEE